MKKAIFIILIALFTISSLIAEDNLTLDSASYLLSAYKPSISGGIPNAEVQIRIEDNNNREVIEGTIVDLPLNARGINYDTFSWILSGNLYGQIEVSFTFGPMYLEADSTSSSIIPYTAKLSHVRSSIGNTTIPYNKVSNATSRISNTFTNYYYKYADSVIVGDDLNISSRAQQVKVTYNMSTNTRIWDANDNPLSTYNLDVCNSWNRYGQATIMMGLKSDGSPANSNDRFPGGIYYANVTVEITSN